MTTIEIVIRYPSRDDAEDTALAYARRLFAVLNESIDTLLLVPDESAGLTVSLNGTTVYTDHQAARPPRLADVLDRLPARE